MVVALAALVFASPALAAPGDLDESFDGDGKVTTDFASPSGHAWDLAVQPDNKIIVTGQSNGDVTLARYNADGSLDTSFDTDGKLVTDFGSSNDSALGLAIQSDGKIVVAGLTNNGTDSDFALARYNADGSLDASFDTDGKLTTDFGLGEFAATVAVQPDGKIIAAGASGSDFALARYNADGSLDASFDTDGKLTTDFASRSENIQDVTIQPDGKVVVAGYTHIRFDGHALDDTAWALARYNADGSLDASFDADGKLTTNLGPDFDRASAIAVKPDGKIFVAGAYRTGDVYAGTSHDDFALVRYDADGSLDASFDGDGKLTTDFGPGQTQDTPYDIAIQADGRIVLAGDSNQRFALARYNPDGSLSPTFDGDGKLIAPGLDNGGARAVAIQPDGKIVAAGGSWPEGSPGRLFTVARFFSGDDAAAPGPVTDFAFTAPKGVGTISLSWTNPTDSDFVSTRIMRVGPGSPCDPNFYNDRHDPNLTTVYEGQATSYLDAGMPFGTYCYVAFARDDNGNWSVASKLTAIPDDSRPVVTIDSGPSGNVSSLSATFAFSSDVPGSTFQCSLDGAPFEACTSPKEYTRLVEGQHSFSVRGINPAGNPGQETLRTWAVVPESTNREVAAGDTLTSDSEGDGATASDPVETSITSPVAGTVSVEESASVTQSSAGYSLLGQQVNIHAPDATAENPLRFVFVLDSSLIPAGEDKDTIQIFRNGAQVQNCTDPTSGAASPDPCVLSRELLAGDDIQFTILTSHASAWNFGVALPVISSPADNSYDTDGIITLSGTAKANTTVEIFEGTTSKVSKGTTMANSSGAWTKTLTGVPNGPHTYTAGVKDAASNISSFSNARTIIVDTLKPTISGMSPRHGSITRDTTPTIRATVKDNNPLAKANIKLYVNGRLISATKYSYTPSTGALVYNSPKLSLGKKTVKIVATDAAGNALTKSWYFTIK